MIRGWEAGMGAMVRGRGMMEVRRESPPGELAQSSFVVVALSDPDSVFEPVDRQAFEVIKTFIAAS